MDESPIKLPAWVRRPDGGVVPLDAEAIRQQIYHASTAVGPGDAFLAHELADSVIHFLSEEADQTIVAESDLKEFAVKVIRELGHLRIAAALADAGGPSPAGAYNRATGASVGACGPIASEIDRWLEDGQMPIRVRSQAANAVLEAYSLEVVYSPDLVKLHRDGVLLLGGLDSPQELTAAVLRLGHRTEHRRYAEGSRPGAWTAFETMEHSRQFVGRTVAFDSPEHELALRGMRIGELPVLLREMDFAARTLGMRVEINLGSPAAPAWAVEALSSPLFDTLARSESQERVAGLLAALAEQLAALPSASALRLNWHLEESDFQNGISRGRLLRLIRSALAGAPITFVCDRDDSPIALADGLSRDCPTILQWVGLNLPLLLDQTPSTNPRHFASRVLNLARLASSAGAQKREFLRAAERRTGRSESEPPPTDRRPFQPSRVPVWPPFFLDQARMGIYLVGLPAIVESFFDAPLTECGQAQEYAEALIRDLVAAVRREGPLNPAAGIIDELPFWGGSLLSSPAETAVRSDWRQQLALASRFHAACGRGMLVLTLDEDRQPDPLRILESLHFAWKQTVVRRIRFARCRRRQTDLADAWRTEEAMRTEN